MFEVKINPAKLKKCFIEYRKANSEWYIVPVPEFDYFSNFIKSYYTDQMLDDLMHHIKKNKMSEFDSVVDNVIQRVFNEEMTFSFESEEDALYFQLKYCS